MPSAPAPTAFWAAVALPAARRRGTPTPFFVCLCGKPALTNADTGKQHMPVGYFSMQTSLGAESTPQPGFDFPSLALALPLSHASHFPLLSVSCMDIESTGSRAVTCGTDSFVPLWYHSHLPLPTPHLLLIYTMAAVAAKSNRDLHNGLAICYLNAPLQREQEMASFSPCGTIVQVSGQESKIHLYDLRKPSHPMLTLTHASSMASEEGIHSTLPSPLGVFAFVSHPPWADGVASATWCRNSSDFLVTGSENGLYMWDVRRGALISTFEEHVHRLMSVSLSPNCDYIASGADDCTCLFVPLFFLFLR